MSRRRRKPKPGLAHYAAPAAFLTAVTIAVLLVHSGLSHESKNLPVPAETRSVTHATTGAAPRSPQPKRFYVVQTGDTFGSIASKEGISVEQLQSLNPNVSSNSLRVGQKLRVK
jgi:LysM repeat protein